MKLSGDTEAAKAFLTEWLDGSCDYIVAHTSGSTGAPKRIDLSKSDMRASAMATCRYFGIDAGSRLLLPLSMDYIAGKMMAVRAAVSDSELVVERPSNAPLQSDYGPVDLMAVVPSQLPSLLENPRLCNVRNIIVGGAPLSPAMEAKLAGLSVRVYATYGMTETCSHVALRDVSRGDQLYHALPGIKLGTDMRGCLVIEAPAFTFGRLITNDVVELHGDDSFRWLGRADNVVNSGGVKLHPEQIERKLSRMVEEPFYVTGRPSERWGEELVMYVEGTDVDVEALASTIRPLLNRYECPKKIMAVSQFDRTANGKVIRRIY